MATRGCPRSRCSPSPASSTYDNPASYNGYLSWWPKDQPWVYATRILARPYLSEIQSFPAEPVPGDVVNRYRVCFTDLQRGGALDCPGASPDGTKVLFNSNMLGSVDAYYVVARLPEAPVGLTARRQADGVHLSWQPPRHHAETAGYLVYRSREAGVGYRQITPAPVPSTELTDADAKGDGPWFYAVTSVEHSGLESGLSAEAAVAAGDAPRRIFVEAEAGERDPRMWVALQGLASDLHYVWMRSRDGRGSITLPVMLPEGAREWTVWARVKGDDGAQFEAGGATGGTARLSAPSSREWHWVRASGAPNLGGGEQQLTLSSGLYGSALDCLVLTDDAGLDPAATPRIDRPAPTVVTGLRAEALSPFAVRLTWTPADALAGGHYNVYCGTEPDFAADQAALVGSPDRPERIDWGLKPGTRLFYRVTCVDRAGNESAPSEAVEITTPAIEPAVLEAAPADTVAFDVPTAGTWALWLKLSRGRGSGQYITVAADGGDARTWTCAWDGLSDESWFTYDGWGRFELTPGRHVFTIDNKTPHTIEDVLLTNDLSLQPEGHINILGGW